LAIRTGNWEPYEKAVEEYEKFDIDSMRQDDIIGQNVLPVYLRIENPLIYDYKGQSAVSMAITKLIATALKNGNDGVIMKNMVDPAPSSTHYIVFKPTQIKSATGNVGEFDPNKSDITKEGMDTPPAIIEPSQETGSSHILNKQKMIDSYILAATIWGEARGEGTNGMQAVLNIIMNRAKGNFSKAVAVALKPKQFSFWNKIHDPAKYALELANSQRSKNDLDHKRYMDALRLVDDARKGTLPDITGGATFYFNPKLANPSWAKEMVITKQIGNHKFLRPK
jgi:spore germination cell wall hydrolase CwlJ-like protein